jgi:FG-GAP repeat
VGSRAHVGKTLSWRFSGWIRRGLTGAAAVAVFLVLLPLAPTAAMAAEAPSLRETLSSPTPGEFGEFGDSLAEDSEYRVVGAWGAEVGGHEDAGMAYVYDEATGSPLYTLESPNPQRFGLFGNQVAVSGKLVVVGAYEETSTASPEDSAGGNVYVFEASTGKLLRTLTSPNAQYEGVFGISVAISGEDVVVGAERETAGGEKRAGNAYVFDGTTGALVRTFTSPEPQEEGYFGSAVAIHGEDVVIGASSEADAGNAEAGKAYVFDLGSGALLDTLTGAARATAGFGSAAAISGETVVIGASGANARGTTEGGEAFVYNLGSGELVSTLTTPNPVEFGEFGSAVAIEGTEVIVGQPETYGEHPGNGNAYVYDADTGELLHTLESPNAQTEGSFGSAVAVHRQDVLVSAIKETVDGHYAAGRAYVLKLTSKEEEATKGLEEQLAGAERKAQEEAAKRKTAEEEAAANKKKAEEEAANKKTAEEEAAADKRKAEEEAANKKTAEEEAAADKRKAEEEAANKKTAEEEAAANKKKAEEEAAARKKAETEAGAQTKKAEEEASAKKTAEAEATASKRKAEEEAAAKKKAETEAGAQTKKAEEEAAARKTAETEAGAQKKKAEEEGAAKKTAEAEAAANKKRAERAATAKKKAEKAAVAKRKAEQEAAKKKKKKKQKGKQPRKGRPKKK